MKERKKRVKILRKRISIIRIATILFLCGCGESRVEEFLKHIPDPSALHINVPVYPSPTTFLKISLHTIGEFNGLFNQILKVKNYARNTAPAMETENEILWNSLGSDESYIYGLFITKTSNGEHLFYIDMAQNVGSAQLYSVAEGRSNRKTTIIVDTKNMHNIDPYVFPDGISVVIFYEKGSTIPVSGIADDFVFQYTQEAGFIHGQFYYTRTEGVNCFYFSREWNYKGELYLMENITGRFCWNENGGKGEGIVKGEEVGNEMNLTECWNGNYNLVFSEYNEYKRGNEAECPF